MFNQHKSPSFGRWLSFFGLINALAMAAISAAILPGDLTPTTYGYLALALSAQFMLLNSVLGGAIYAATFFIKSLRVKKIISAILFTCALFIVVVNVNVFQLYRFHLNGMVINLLFGGALLNNLSFSFSMWLSIIASFAGITAVGFALAALGNWLARKFSLKTWQLLALSFSLFAGVQIFHGFSDAYNQLSITQQDRFIPWYQPVTMRKTLIKLGVKIDNTAPSISAQAPKFSGLNYPKAALQCNSQQPLNIVMLVVDSLRADVLTPAVMPNTSQLQQQALSFSQHYSTGNATRYGIFGLMYGLTANYWQPMLTERRGSVLFDATQQLGYQHFIYGSAPLTSPEFNSTVFSQLQAPLNKGSHKTSDENDQEISDKFLQDIANHDTSKPFFGFVFFDSPHAYSVPKAYQNSFEPMWAQVNYMELNNKFDSTPFFNRYKASVQFDDHLIGDILAALSRKNMLGNTVVVITGDHGQEFNDMHKNFWGHNSNFSKYQTHVPMVIYWPNQAAQTITRTSSHEDLVPALLHHALGCSNPTADFSTGYDLLTELPESRNLVLENWTERAIRQQDQLYVFDQFGKMNFVDDNYDPIMNTKPDTQMLKTALEHLSLFMKK